MKGALGLVAVSVVVYIFWVTYHAIKRWRNPNDNNNKIK